MENLILTNGVFIGALAVMFTVLGQNMQSRILGIILLILSIANLSFYFN